MDCYNYNRNDYKMPQLIIYTNDEENEKVIAFSKIWGLSKVETMKKMIRNFVDIEEITDDELKEGEEKEDGNTG